MPNRITGRGRRVFSSSEDQNRTPGNKATQKSHAARSLVLLMNGIGESLFATLFPSDCRICRKPLVNISRLPVCRDCLSQIHAISCEVCAICGESIATPYALSEQERLLCGACRQDEPPFAKAVAYGSYNGNLREMIHLLKYEHVKPVAHVLGTMLAEAISGMENSLPAQELIVVPVPLHKSKRRQRAFNQAEAIAKAALRSLEKQRAGNGTLPWKLNTRVLERCRATQSQIGLTRSQRRENMRGAFTVIHQKNIQNQTVLLVDDVVTTGTTVAECARVLCKAGASKVYVASVARTLRMEVQGFGVESFRPDFEGEDLAATGS